MSQPNECRECKGPGEQVHGYCRACFNQIAAAFDWAQAYYREEQRANDLQAQLRGGINSAPLEGGALAAEDATP